MKFISILVFDHEGQNRAWIFFGGEAFLGVGEEVFVFRHFISNTASSYSYASSFH